MTLVDTFFATSMGSLRRVHYIYHSDLHRPIAVRLFFESDELSVAADANTDEIVVEEGCPPGREIDVTSRHPWKDAIDMNCLWCWRLTNQNNYVDGVQFLFADPSTADVCIQLVVVASQFEVHQVSVVDNVTLAEDPTKNDADSGSDS